VGNADVQDWHRLLDQLRSVTMRKPGKSPGFNSP
jgi:hypothetical protein